jgi:glycosyltransferase involved in cell wall biosynthesis
MNLLTKPTISFILPTKGRQSLQNLISRLRDDIGPEDEVIVIGDGPQPVARGIMSFGDWRFSYFETEPTGHWGNAQRAFGISRASRDFLFFIDDDDSLLPDALSIIRPHLSAEPNAPHVYRLGHEGTQPLRSGMVDARGCFVPPNIKSKLGSWTALGLRGHRCQGWEFIRGTMEHYPRAIYHSEEVYVLRPGEGNGKVVAGSTNDQLHCRN